MFDDLFDDEIKEDIAPPVIEAEEGLFPARESSLCIGHEGAEGWFKNHIDNKTMPHAVIFAGPQGIGKTTFAFRIARYLLKHGLESPEDNFDIDAQDPVFRRVASGGHADLLTIERPMDEKKGTRKASVDVETVRKIAPFLRMKSSSGGWRIVIIDDADTMNRNAQNALLKILEEPPEKVLIILSAHRLGAFIPTIRSRTHVIPFMPLEQDTVVQLLQREYQDQSQSALETVASMAEGSVGKAMEILEDGGVETLSDLSTLLEAAPRWNWVDIHRFSETVGRFGAEKLYKSFENNMLWIMESMLKAKARKIHFDFPLNESALKPLSDHYSLEEWIKICENLKDHFQQVEHANLDRRQSVLRAFHLIGNV